MMTRYLSTGGWSLTVHHDYDAIFTGAAVIPMSGLVHVTLDGLDVSVEQAHVLMNSERSHMISLSRQRMYDRLRIDGIELTREEAELVTGTGDPWLMLGLRGNRDPVQLIIVPTLG